MSPRRVFASSAGFSLSELMVTVAIVGILVALGSLNFANFATRAKYAKARDDLLGTAEVISGYRIDLDETLMLITGNFCTMCTGNPLASWQAIGFDAVPTDPWGQPYQMDENEAEFSPQDCRPDSLFSGGADLSFDSSVDGFTPYGDDLVVHVPLMVPNRGPCVQMPPWQVGPAWNF